MKSAVNILKELEEITVSEPFTPRKGIGTYGKNGLTLVAALSSTFAANSSPAYRLNQEHIINNPGSRSRLFVSSDWSGVVDDASDIKSISAGVPRFLDMDWLSLSLNEHNGGRLSKTQFEDFRNTMSGFSGIHFLECYVAYRNINNLIRSTIILDHDFSLLVTYFVDQNDGEVAFSLEYNTNTVLTGHGTSSDIARAVTEIINAVKEDNG